MKQDLVLAEPENISDLLSMLSCCRLSFEACYLATGRAIEVLELFDKRFDVMFAANGNEPIERYEKGGNRN